MKPELEPLEQILEAHVYDQHARAAIRLHISRIRRGFDRKAARRATAWQLTAAGFAVVLWAAFERWI